MATTDSVAVEADALHEAHKVEEEYRLMETTVDKDGNMDAPMLWRFARACYCMANETSDRAEMKALIQHGLGLANESVFKDATDGNGIKWSGVLLWSIGGFIPTKDKIHNAFVIKEFFDKAAKLLPADATALHCLAKWHWNVMHASKRERALAAKLFAKPPTSTYEECEAALMKCYELNPKHRGNVLLLGDLNYARRKLVDAKVWYERAADLEANTEFHKKIQKEAIAKAEKCG